MTFSADKPWNELPDLPPDLAFTSSPETVRNTIEARARLAELKGYCRTLPNPEILLSTIVLQESKDASEIENVEQH